MLVYDWLWWGQLTNQNRVRRGAQRCVEVHGGVSLQLIRLCLEVSLQLFRLCGGVSLQLFKLCGGVSLQLGCVEGCHSN